MLLMRHQSCGEVWGCSSFWTTKTYWWTVMERWRTTWEKVSGQLCAGRDTLMKDMHSVARDRCRSPEAIYLWNNYERTVDSWIFITVCVQHSFLIHILLEMKCCWLQGGGGEGREGKGTLPARVLRYCLSFPPNPLTVLLSENHLSKLSPAMSPKRVQFWSSLRRTQVFNLLRLQIKASLKGARPGRASKIGACWLLCASVGRTGDLIRY